MARLVAAEVSVEDGRRLIVAAKAKDEKAFDDAVRKGSKATPGHEAEAAAVAALAEAERRVIVLSGLVAEAGDRLAPWGHCPITTGCQNPDAVAPAAKFRKTTADVEEFLDAIPNPQRRADARELVPMMADIADESPAVWTSNIVGFGEGHYRSPSGREGVAPLAAFAPRRDSLVVYLVGGYQERYPRLLAQLGPHRTGNSCLYLKSLADVDVNVLRRLIERSTDAQRGMDRAATRSE